MATDAFSAETGSVSKGPESRAKATALLGKLKLPAVLFPLATIDEFGFNESSGFMWMKQPGRSEKEFPDAEIVVHYGRMIHGYAELHCLKKLVGFKVKEMKEKNLFISIPYSEIKVDGDTVMLLSDQGDPRAFSASLLQVSAAASHFPNLPSAVAPPQSLVTTTPMSLATSPSPIGARPVSFIVTPITMASAPGAVAARPGSVPATPITVPSTLGPISSRPSAIVTQDNTVAARAGSLANIPHRS